MEINKDEKNNIIDVPYTQVNNSYYKNCFTIDEVAKELKVDEFKIVYWYTQFNYLLNIQSIGMYQIFDSSDLENLRKIKSLNIDEGMDVESIKEYFKMHKNAITIRETRMVGNNDIGIIEILSKIIDSQNGKLTSVVKMNEKLIKNQDEFLKVITKMNKEVAIGKEQQIKKLNRIEKNQQEQNKEINKISSKIDNQQSELKAHIDIKEQEAQARYLEMHDRLIEKMKERKIENINQNKQGFFSRLFKSKKE